MKPKKVLLVSAWEEPFHLECIADEILQDSPANTQEACETFASDVEPLRFGITGERFVREFKIFRAW
jgi:hypothetical protein